MRSLSFLWAVALAAIWVGVAQAEEADTASAQAVDAATGSAEAGAPADDDPFAEFAEATDEGEAEAEPAAADAAPAAEVAVETGSEIAVEAEPEVVVEVQPTTPGAAGDPSSADAAATESDTGWAEAMASPRERPAPTTASGRPVVIGPIGVDDQGRRGRIHTVASGDTLWDISNAYLGTPWVWPSVWHENDNSIENPHLIRPGDLIWITSTEMRRVSSEEADALMAGAPTDGSETEVVATPTEMPTDDAAPLESDETTAPGPAAVNVEVASIDLPADIDAESLSMPGGPEALMPAGATIRIAWRENMSFVSSETVEASASIVEPPRERTWLAEGDVIQVGFGEGDVEPGDQFTVFRDIDPVRDMDGSLLGYQVEVLGWIEIQTVHPETSTATIEVSVAEMHVGDLLAPREVPLREVAIREAPSDFSGQVVHFPDHRTVVASGDYLYIDRGSIHGLEVGSHLEVFAPGQIRKDVVRRARVETSAIPMADLVVVSVRPDASVAYVASAETEIERGAHVRAASPRVASLP
jgi:nucleoid-associated protein YgaU